VLPYLSTHLAACRRALRAALPLRRQPGSLAVARRQHNTRNTLWLHVAVQRPRHEGFLSFPGDRPGDRPRDRPRQPGFVARLHGSCHGKACHSACFNCLSPNFRHLNIIQHHSTSFNVYPMNPHETLESSKGTCLNLSACVSANFCISLRQCSELRCFGRSLWRQSLLCQPPRLKAAWDNGNTRRLCRPNQLEVWNFTITTGI